MKFGTDKFYDTAMVAVGCFLGFTAMFIIAMMISTVKTERQLEEIQKGDFYSKCAAACSPSAVYSTNYNRCECNAIVTVREIK
jgi:hypothetical protein